MATTLFDRTNAPILVGSIFGSMGGGVNAALTIYIQTHLRELTADKIALLAASGLLGVALAFVIVLPVSKVFGKKRTTLALYAVTLLGVVAPVILRLLGLFPDNGSPVLVPLLFVFMTVVAMAVVTASILVASMVSDVTDQILLKTGRQSEGMILSATTFVGKAVSGMGVLVSGLILTLVSFPEGAKPGAVDIAVVHSLAFWFALATLVFTSMALVIMSFYPVSEDDHRFAVEENVRQRAAEN
ncbi:MAG: MFS transporter [Alphaproteobacteria bacterium]|nr:MFS transporter [Alphaproteobacteria bacterium]